MPRRMKRRHRRRTLPTTPRLRFAPTAWAKLRFLRDRGPTEIGGFGLSAADDPLLVVDLLVVKQRATPVTVAFDDGALADLFDRMVDRGFAPERFGRIWIHTHPGACPRPSSVDDRTFRRAFGGMDWAVMAILARNDATYAQLAFHVGPSGAWEIPVGVSYERPFSASDPTLWEQEYREQVQVELIHHAQLSDLEDEGALRGEERAYSTGINRYGGLVAESF